MKTFLFLAMLATAIAVAAGTAGDARPASTYTGTCGVVTAGGKRWFVMADGPTCATSRSILRQIAAKAKGTKDNTSIKLGVHAGMRCQYLVFSGNAGITCTAGSKTMRANWVRG